MKRGSVPGKRTKVTRKAARGEDRKEAREAAAKAARKVVKKVPSTGGEGERRRPASKVRRWMDLLAALLVRHYPATFEELARDIPAYLDRSKSAATLMRMFERDKNELRAFGVPIETVQSDGDEIGAYRLAGRDFYLPYLRAVAPSGAAQRDPRHVDKFGYRALTTLSFEADELAAVLAAAERVQSLGDPHLALDAESAVRKLSVDLPLGELEGADEVRFVPPREQAARAVFEALGDALTRRKWVSFDYHAMSTDRSERRHVEPYGLFFLGSHWYLAARDRDRGELRNFRLNRISAPEVNATNSLSPDYDIAAGFQLREHARSRQPWEIGEGDSTDSVVEFRDHAGADAPAARLGTLVAGCENRRLFRVRRMDVFARWLLSLQGDAVPMSPDALVREYHDQVRRTLAVYNEAERPKRGPRSTKRGHRTEGGGPA